MRLLAPRNLHYPITVTELRKRAGDDVAKQETLFVYTYKSTVTEGNKYGETEEVEKSFFTNFESETEGLLKAWFIKEGTVIESAGDRVELCEIEEACSHEVQFGGLCANCGKDVTGVTYNTSTRDSERAQIRMTHGNVDLTVSSSEATRIEEEAKRRLLRSRKLSLVVDLDQTIIHATVDPTVAEWQRDETNPNYPAVKDVRAFQLVDDGPGARGCWYYIKLRPRLAEFLEAISKVYELHIYTMGTRAYAQNIAKIVDPKRTIFGDRILSRDESGSLTAKNLHRLFPIDTKMVVIIDDRGDVWKWTENLVKVPPYDFFVGIGDINSSFLPPKPQITGPKAEQIASEASTDMEESPEGRDVDDRAERVATQGLKTPSGQQPPMSNGDVSTLDRLVQMGGGNNPGRLQEQTSQQGQALAHQLADRPLLQKQKRLEAAEEAARSETASTSSSEEKGEEECQDLPAHTEEGTAGSPQPEPPTRHNLLHDDDTELDHLEAVLRAVHRRFYSEYDSRIAGVSGGRVAELRPGKQVKKQAANDLAIVPDVKEIMPAMKRKTLGNVVLVFSGIVPLGTNIQHSDIALWAKSFGATVTEKVTKRTTHVIAVRGRRTAKVRQAARRPNIKIVSVQWLLDSFSRWEKQDEQPYLIHVEPDTKGHDNAAGNASPLDDLDEGTVLSNSEEDPATGTEDEASNGGTGLKIDIVDSGGVVTTDDEGVMTEASPDSLSPIKDTQADWDEMNAELDEFLEGESEDSDASDAESTRSEDRRDGTATPPSAKRKRREKDDGDELQPSADESDASTASGRGSSELQKRKKRALERVTSLTQVIDATSATTTPTTLNGGGGEEAASKVKNAGGSSQVDNNDDGYNTDPPDFDIDEFEKAFEKEFAKEQGEEQGADVG